MYPFQAMSLSLSRSPQYNSTLKRCNKLVNKRARTDAVALGDDGTEASDLERRTRDGGRGEDDPVYPHVVRILKEIRNITLVLLRVVLHGEQVSVPTLTWNINEQRL